MTLSAKVGRRLCLFHALSVHSMSAAFSATILRFRLFVICRALADYRRAEFTPA
jgi:hypothetical protein